MQLVADELTIARGARIVLQNVSITVDSGEVVLLTGPNGSGKTTLLRTIAGYLQPESGSVTFSRPR